MGFSRQEYWSGLPFPSPADLPDPGIKPSSPALQADALSSEPPGNSLTPEPNNPSKKAELMEWQEELLNENKLRATIRRTK